MTKQDVKDLCEGDEKLAWWAMVLFAEICEFTAQLGHPGDEKTLVSMLRSKVNEFPSLVIQTQLERTREKFKQQEAESEAQPK